MPLLIDCDPGIDDAIALLLTLGSPSLDLRGITTVAGNVTVTQTTTNALRILELAQRPDIPVYPGCPVPLVRSSIFVPEIHGEDGLGGVDLPAPTLAPQGQSGVQAILTALQEPITIATLGPLTNLAVALIQAPHLSHHIQQLVIMGGAMGQGNITPSAEFNFFADPHGAQVVFDRVQKYQIPTTLIGLEITHQVIATPHYQQRLAELQSPVSRAILQMLSTYAQTPEAQEYGFAGPPLHDPCVIAYLLQPQLFQTRSATVAIEMNSALTLGRSVITGSQTPSSLQVATAIHVEGFFELLISRISGV